MSHVDLKRSCWDIERGRTVASLPPGIFKCRRNKRIQGFAYSLNSSTSEFSFDPEWLHGQSYPTRLNEFVL